jgi:hypothetical protein
MGKSGFVCQVQTKHALCGVADRQGSPYSGFPRFSGSGKKEKDDLSRAGGFSRQKRQKLLFPCRILISKPGQRVRGVFQTCLCVVGRQAKHKAYYQKTGITSPIIDTGLCVSGLLLINCRSLTEDHNDYNQSN